MWFKNLIVFRLNDEFTYTPEELEELLQEKTFSPCGSQDQSQFGWVPPLGHEGTLLTHATGGYIMLCAKKQEKILPAAVIKDEVEAKVQAIRDSQDRKVSRKERDEIKDEVIHSLLPRAFTRSKRLYGYISPKDQLLIIDTSSRTKAEEFVDGIRECLGSFPVIPPTAKNEPVDVLTHWTQLQEIPEEFAIGRECELSDPLEEGNRIRCKAQDLDAEEVQAHIEAGKKAIKLAVVWQDNLQCVIEEDLSIKRLKFSDMIVEQAESSDAESFAEQFDQDFAVMSLQLSVFLKDLFKAFGGLKRRNKGAI